MSIDREDWTRDNRFKKLAHLIWKELRASKGNEEAVLTQRLYDVVVMLTLPAAWERFNIVLREQLAQREDIFIDVPDISAWPDHSDS